VAAVRPNWPNVNYAAEPYLAAMEEMVAAGLDPFADAYYSDPPGSVVRYFVGNASGWRGDVARAVRAEMRRRLA
jgi:hypothetical protein